MKEPQVDIASLVSLDPEDPDIIPAALEADLVSKHGTDLMAIRTAAGAVVIRKVSKQEYAEYRSRLFDEKTRAASGEFLAQVSCVWPEKPVLRGMIDSFPGITAKMVEVASELVGSDASAPKKKLGQRR